MKSMLYVGATLMIGASIYGFADYKKNSQRKEFKSMYTEEKKTEPVTDAVKKEPAPVNEKEVVTKSKPVVTRKKIVVKEDLPAIQPIAAEDKMVTGKTTLPEKTSVTITPSKEISVIKTVTKKRRLSSKLFSRAPLRDEIEEVKVPVKEEAKKTENKGQ